jgi:hypothetical protein
MPSFFSNFMISYETSLLFDLWDRNTLVMKLCCIMFSCYGFSYFWFSFTALVCSWLTFAERLFISMTFYLVVNKFMKINQCPTCSLLFYWVSNSGWDMVTCLQLCGLWDVQLHTLHWNVLYKLIQTLLLLEKRFVINLIMSSSV